MSNYRITFLRNNLISCIETDQKLQNNEHSYYFNDVSSHITCMLIHALGKEEAIKEAATILEKTKNDKSSAWPSVTH
ncbi:MAG: hypothetical protein JSS96_00735 [Bacteroidetes bacterium]|nr:hypothetical protein [Bacteroidota bacterium]